MQKLDESLLGSYDYDLPSELIATYPANPRESARLLVYNRATKEITHSTFSELFSFLPKDIGVILNDTKVIKARIFGKKESGGKVELLFNSPLNNNKFKVYIRGKVAKGTKLFFDEGLVATILELHDDGVRVVSFTCKDKLLGTTELFVLLDKIGHIPLPPYIKREDEKEDAVEYQSVFAKNYGAVAAPTASLHFSKEMLEILQKNYDVNYVTLHIGAGTFKSVEVENIHSHKMHEEFFSIPHDTKKLLESTKKLLCVGTTSTRTVEYFARIKKDEGYCDLFLNTKNPPIRTDFLLTNFHLPKSTLIMLVSSFIGLSETLRIYKTAVSEKYRFFSYGDAMLII
ncbi:MAG: tRNA preQ1(34) S-adenosylmethionine ribosyltransferase-isomerase QueA [Campylobacteraceae bacterium]